MFLKLKLEVCRPDKQAISLEWPNDKIDVPIKGLCSVDRILAHYVIFCSKEVTKEGGWGISPNSPKRRSYNSILAAYPWRSVLENQSSSVSYLPPVAKGHDFTEPHPCQVRMRITVQPLPCPSVHAHIDRSSREGGRS